MYKKSTCYFGLCVDSKEVDLNLLLAAPWGRNGSDWFCDTTRINIPMVIKLVRRCLAVKWSLGCYWSPALQDKHRKGISSGCGKWWWDHYQENYRNRASIDTREEEEEEELEYSSSSDQYLFFQWIILAILHLFTATMVRLLQLLEKPTMHCF